MAEQPRPGHGIIVVGGSAGGVDALMQLAGSLPPELPASLFVVLHVPPHAPSALPHILDRAGPLPAAHARHGEAIQRGRIYVAPPDHHLLVRRGWMEVVRGPRENGARPALDPLFRSAAAAYGPCVVGVVLSGTLDDGTAGLLAVKQRAGMAVVQDPATALFPGMPASAMEHVQVDHCLALASIGPLLARLARAPVDVHAHNATHGAPEEEVQIAEMNHQATDDLRTRGDPSGFSCPDCGGVLWESQDGALMRFRCRAGHAYGADNLLSAQSDALESALWAALRALEENAAFARRLQRRAAEQGQFRVAERFAERVEDAEQRAELIRRVLADGRGISAEGGAESTETAATD